MTGYDYVIISVFLVFMFLLGPIYKSFSKTSSDFFRGGGGMLWWVVGSSAFTLVINQTSIINSMLYGGARYVFAKDAKDGKIAVLVALFGFLFLSPIWMIPALGASILHPVEDDGFIVIKSLDELRKYASGDNLKIRMKPDVYKLNTAKSRHFIELTGDDNHWDFTGVTISASLDLFRQFGKNNGAEKFYCVIDLSGNRNILEGLTVKNHGSGFGIQSKNKLFNITGSDCTVRNITAVTSGSNPWGYGSLFGISGGVVRKMNGIRIGQPSRNTRLIGSRVQMRAMGHAIFIQGAVNTLIEDCHVDGLLRHTNEILTETSSYAFEQGFKVPGYGEGVQIGEDQLIPPNEIVSLSEDGIRMYPSNENVKTGSTTIKNCTVTNMRRGICTGLSAASDQVVNCEVKNCIAAGFNVGANDAVVGCRADAKYAEALCVPYLHSKGAKVELEILDSRKRTGNNLLAKINGSNHKVSLHTANPLFVPKEMTIELASTNGYGSFQKGKRKAEGVILNNQTPARVILLPGTVGNTIISRGPVTDKSTTDNTIHYEK